jgi:hypothetical protein
MHNTAETAQLGDFVQFVKIAQMSACFYCILNNNRYLCLSQT